MKYRTCWFLLATLVLIFWIPNNTLPQDSISDGMRFDEVRLENGITVLLYDLNGVKLVFSKDTNFTNLFYFDFEGDDYFGYIKNDSIELFDIDFNIITSFPLRGEVDNNRFRKQQLWMPGHKNDFEDLNLEIEDKFDLNFGADQNEDYDRLLHEDDADDDKVEDNELFLGNLSKNKYSPEGINNPYGQYGNPYSPTSIKNPYGQYGNPYSPNSINNPFATETPKVYAPDGTYLGKLSSNPYDYESISNPYGPYGSEYSPTSINNPYSPYGSPYSPTSVNNPYSTNPPIIIFDESED